MKIVQVSTNAYYRDIPLKGWESVKTALNAFASGATKGARATTDHQVKAVADSLGGEGLAFYALGASHMQGAEDEFVNRLLSEAETALKVRNKWERSYDYDGMGSFFKTGVSIGVLDREEEMYYLSIWAAYVGDKPEEGLAEALGIPRALFRAEVEIQVEPKDADHFLFDFESVLRHLDGVLDIGGLTGEQVATRIREGTADRWDQDLTVQIFKEGDIMVSLSPDQVEDRYQEVNGELVDTWVFAGSTLSGLLHESRKEGKDKDDPVLTFDVYHYSEDRYYPKLIYKPEDKEKVLALSERIAQAFS